MMWNYSRMLISEEDFYRSSKPKKALCLFGLGWSGIAAILRLKYMANPETIMKGFLTTLWSPLFFVSPLVAVGYYIRWQSRIYHEIYERTVGHMSDREMLELDVKLNPNKRVVY